MCAVLDPASPAPPSRSRVGYRFDRAEWPLFGLHLRARSGSPLTPLLPRLLTLGHQARPVRVEGWTLLFREERPHLLNALVWIREPHAKSAALCADGGAALRVGLLLGGFELGPQLPGAPSLIQPGLDDLVHPA